MTAARDAAELVEALAHPTTAARDAAELVEALAHPTTAARSAAIFVEVLTGPPAVHPPLRLRQRGDDLKAPRLPKFHDSRQRSPRLRTYQ